MIRALARATGAFALALALTAQSPPPQLTPVRVVFTPDDAITPILWAQKTGMFAKAGLTMTFERSTSGTAATAAVIAGAYDIGEGSLMAALNGFVKGLPIKLIAGAILYDDKAPNAQLIVAQDVPIKTGKDLEGKVVSSPALRDMAQIAVMAWTEKHGGDWRTLQFVEIPQSAAAPALAAHRTNASVLSEPVVSTALADGKVRSLGPAYTSIAPRFLEGAYFCTGAWAAAHPDIVAKFARVIGEATAYVDAHPDETAPVLAEFTGIPLATIQKMQRVPHEAALKPAEIQPLIDAGARYGALPRAFPAQDLIAAEAR